MKKFLLFLTLVLFSQQNNLDAIHPHEVGHKSSRHPDKLANLRIHIEKEAQAAAAAIQEWLTPELAHKLVLSSNDPQDSNAVQLNTKVLRGLPIGKQVVLTGWTTYPRYCALVYYHFKARQILGEEGLVELVFDYTDFGRALIEFNFYPGISERIDALGKKDFQPITRMQEFIPQLRHLKYQSSCMNSLEFKDQVEKYGDDLLDCLFVLQHPYLFLGYLEDCLKDKKYEIIELFLECGFDPSCPIMNLLNETSNTLLYSAVCDEKIEAVLLLLKWGADPLSTNSLNVSPWALSLKKIEDNNYDLSALSKNAQKIHTKLCDYVPQNKVKAYLQAIQIKTLFEDYRDDSRELIAE